MKITPQIKIQKTLKPSYLDKRVMFSSESNIFAEYEEVGVGGGSSSVSTSDFIVGDGSAEHPLKISLPVETVLINNGTETVAMGFQAFIQMILGQLGVYINDEAAILGGLDVGDFYIVDAGSDIATPGTIKRITA